MLKEIVCVILGVAIVVGIVGAFFVGADFGYDRGYGDSQKKAYADGYTSGHGAGYRKAIQDVNAEIDKILTIFETDTKIAFIAIPGANPVIEWLFNELRNALYFRMK